MGGMNGIFALMVLGVTFFALLILAVTTTSGLKDSSTDTGVNATLQTLESEIEIFSILGSFWFYVPMGMMGIAIMFWISRMP